jgi:hypothetical protein
MLLQCVWYGVLYDPPFNLCDMQSGHVCLVVQWVVNGDCFFFFFDVRWLAARRWISGAAA